MSTSENKDGGQLIRKAYQLFDKITRQATSSPDEYKTWKNWPRLARRAEELLSRLSSYGIINRVKSEAVIRCLSEARDSVYS
jgi:hypothetical protein